MVWRAHVQKLPVRCMHMKEQLEHLWKHHVNLLLQSFTGVSTKLISLVFDN